MIVALFLLVGLCSQCHADTNQTESPDQDSQASPPQERHPAAVHRPQNYPLKFLNITILDARTTFDTFHGPNLYIRGKVHHVDSNDTKYLFQTNVVENTVKPHFNHTWLYDEARSEPPPEGFTTNDMIVFEIYDHRKTESDLWMGSCQVDLRDAHRHNESGKMKMCRVNRNIWMTTVHYIVTWIVDLQSFAEAGFRSQDVGFDRPPDIVDNPAVLPHAPSHPIEEK